MSTWLFKNVLLQATLALQWSTFYDVIDDVQNSCNSTFKTNCSGIYFNYRIEISQALEKIT